VDEDSDSPLAITEVDHGTLEMKVTSSRLQEQIDEIQRQIEECVHNYNLFDLPNSHPVLSFKTNCEDKRAFTCEAESSRTHVSAFEEAT
jgi:hypothetical protein